MIKFLVVIVSLLITVLRSYLVFKVLYWLVLNFNNSDIDFNPIKWVLVGILLDMYLVSIEKSYELYIYREKEDG
jgi:hypothetical protein